jgi:hypothetical protein
VVAAAPCLLLILALGGHARGAARRVGVLRGRRPGLRLPDQDVCPCVPSFQALGEAGVKAI